MEQFRDKICKNFEENLREKLELLGAKIFLKNSIKFEEKIFKKKIGDERRKTFE